MAMITQSDRIRRGLERMKKFRDGLKSLIDEELEGNNILQVRILRNYEELQLAEVNRQIQRAEYELNRAKITDAMQEHPRIMNGGYKE